MVGIVLKLLIDRASQIHSTPCGLTSYHLYNQVPLPVIAIPGANLAGQYWFNQGAQVFFFPYNVAICKLRFKLTKFSYLRLFSLTIHLKFILFYDRVSCQTLNFNPGQIQLTPTPVIISTNTFTFTNM